MIEVRGLTKRYGDRVAVSELTFAVEPGRVTGFLGPNGAGKSTTMRLILGLDAPSAGSALVEGQSFRAQPWPLRAVGAVLDPKAFHARRTARKHLLAVAATVNEGRDRVEEVLHLVGLSDVADDRAGGFSLGMSQRLSLAAALIGDPRVLILDEPVNGLDPDGVRWIRMLLRSLAEEGRTVFLSSHLMSEMSQTADHLVVIGKGRVIADTSVEALLATSEPSVRVHSLDDHKLRSVLSAAGAEVESSGGGGLTVRRLDSKKVSRLAMEHHIVLTDLGTRHQSLEDAFMDLTADAVEYGQPAGAGTAPSPDSLTRAGRNV